MKKRLIASLTDGPSEAQWVAKSDGDVSNSAVSEDQESLVVVLDVVGYSARSNSSQLEVGQLISRWVQNVTKIAFRQTVLQSQGDGVILICQLGEDPAMSLGILK